MRLCGQIRNSGKHRTQGGLINFSHINVLCLLPFGKLDRREKMLLLMSSSLLLLFSASTVTAANSADHLIKRPKDYHHINNNKCAYYRPSDNGGGMHHHHRVKRIANGTQGDIHAMPWMVFVSSLILTSGNNVLYNCTGSLVSRRHVLTAAHCLKLTLMPNSSYTITVYYGSANKNTARSVVLPKSAIHRHPNYTSVLLNNNTFIVSFNDLAIIDLGQDLELDDTVQPVCLVCLNNSTYPQGPAIIAGWGSINPVCTGLPSVYPDIFNYQSVGIHQCLTPGYVSADNVCTQADLTHGVGGTDSGGPALASYNDGRSFLQVGVNGANNCRADQRENAFDKVDKEWFEQITGIKCKNFPEG